MREQKKDYNAPEIRELGSVTDLTQTGNTQAGGDGKTGSKGSQGV